MLTQRKVELAAAEEAAKAPPEEQKEVRQTGAACCRYRNTVSCKWQCCSSWLALLQLQLSCWQRALMVHCPRISHVPW